MFKKKKSGQSLTKKITNFSKKAGEEVIEHAQENIVDRISHVREVRLLILEWSLLVIAIIFLAIAQAYWYSESYAVETYTDGGTYTEGTLGEVNSLNPLFAQTSSEKTLSKLLFASLSSPDYSGHSGYDLAKSITSDSDAKNWTITLRDGLKWSDGEPLTNDDVIFTANLIKNPLVNSSYSSNLSRAEVSETNDGKIQFTLPSSNVYFATSLDFPILPEHILKDANPELLLESSFSSKPISSGPYVYNATQAIGSKGEKSVYLSANENYYKGKPLIDSFIVHAFTTEDDIVTALNAGTITASGDLSGDNINKITSTSLDKHETSLNYGVFAFLNNDSLNKQLRTALKQGIDMNKVREGMNEHELKYPFTETQIQLDEYPEDTPIDTEVAETTIAQQLQKNNTLNTAGLSIVTVNSGNLPKVAEKFAEQVRELGMKADVTTYESDQDFALNVLSARAYDVLIYEVGLGPDPDVLPYYHYTEATSNGHNLSNYKNGVASDLILSASTLKNLGLRKKKYERFLKYFVDDVPALGICQTNYTYFANSNVKTFSSENRLVTKTDRFTDVSDWGIEKATKNRTP